MAKGKRKIFIDVEKGVHGGYALYVGDKDSGHRISGNKPWGGSYTIHRFEIDVNELIEQAKRFGGIK